MVVHWWCGQYVARYNGLSAIACARSEAMRVVWLDYFNNMLATDKE